jgi:hypothetical protein
MATAGCRRHFDVTEIPAGTIATPSVSKNLAPAMILSALTGFDPTASVDTA